MAAAELLKLSHAYKATVETTDGGGAVKVLDRKKHNYVLTTLVSNLEKTFTISPRSRPLDGQLRLVHFGDVGGQRTMEVMKAAYRDGEHVGMRWKTSEGEKKQAEGEEEEQEVGYDEVDEVKVAVLEEDPRWRKVCIDGTIVEIEQGGWVKVAMTRQGEERLRVLVDRAVL
ncbi:hypothetical protein B0T17DRAFT_520917 [Bombardia bombarda]|uniref:Uncharacterized protein n=1 Tax=Bombardia bombarda TaxID=252184 RepID=A0AA39XNB4_9PEZI|nr:hypothetical protein B0T17DRAFT_520917 [Bombardia bombarda]